MKRRVHLETRQLGDELWGDRGLPSGPFSAPALVFSSSSSRAHTGFCPFGRCNTTSQYGAESILHLRKSLVLVCSMYPMKNIKMGKQVTKKEQVNFQLYNCEKANDFLQRNRPQWTACQTRTMEILNNLWRGILFRNGNNVYTCRVKGKTEETKPKFLSI